MYLISFFCDIIHTRLMYLSTNKYEDRVIRTNFLKSHHPWFRGGLFLFEKKDE